MLKKIEIWCSRQVVACKTEVVASRGVGAYKYDNVNKIKITYHIKKERFSLYGFPREISISVYFMCVIDVKYSIAHFPTSF